MTDLRANCNDRLFNNKSTFQRTKSKGSPMNDLVRPLHHFVTRSLLIDRSLTSSALPSEKWRLGVTCFSNMVQYQKQLPSKSKWYMYVYTVHQLNISSTLSINQTVVWICNGCLRHGVLNLNVNISTNVSESAVQEKTINVYPISLLNKKSRHVTASLLNEIYTLNPRGKDKYFLIYNQLTLD